MPPGMDKARVSRPRRRAWLGVPVGAAFIGCLLVPTLPASADATLDLDLSSRSALPGTAFSLPLSVRNTLESAEVTISEATATADSSDVTDLAVVDLPEVLSQGDTAEAEVVGSVVGEPEESQIRIEVEIAYSYPAPCEAPEPSASADDESCLETPLTGTARVSAWLRVPQLTPKPTPTPTVSPSVPAPSPSATPTAPVPPERPSTPPPPPHPSATPSSPSGQPSATPSPRSSSPQSPIPHSPVSTLPPQSAAGGPSSPPGLPTDTAHLPELAAPSDEYAELPMVTPGEENSEQDGAAPVSQEGPVDPLLTPFILLLVLMLLLLLATPLGPVRRVRVRHSYVGRRRKR